MVAASLIHFLVILAKLGLTEDKNSSKDITKDKDALMKSYSVEILAFWLLLLRTAILYPLLKVFYSNLVCWRESAYLGHIDTCYAGAHLWYTAASAGCVCWILVLILFNAVAVNDFNPLSKVPFAGIGNSHSWVHLVVQVSVPMMGVLDSKVKKLKKLKFFGIVYTLLVSFLGCL